MCTSDVPSAASPRGASQPGYNSVTVTIALSTIKGLNGSRAYKRLFVPPCQTSWNQSSTGWVPCNEPLESQVDQNAGVDASSAGVGTTRASSAGTRVFYFRYALCFLQADFGLVSGIPYVDAVILGLALFYLTASPGVLPGFVDTFFWSPLDLALAKKIKCAATPKCLRDCTSRTKKTTLPP